AEALKLQYGQAVVPGANLYTQPQRSQPVNGKSHPAGAHAAARAGEDDGASRFAARRNAVSLAQEEMPGEPYWPLAEEVLEAQTFEGSKRRIPRGDLNEVLAVR